MWQYLVFLGAAANFLGGFSYIRDTLRGTTKPNRVTWLMWFIISTIATAAALKQGVGWAVVPVFISGFIPLLIFLASFINKNAYWRLGVFDYACGLLSALALILWAMTKEPNLAIIFAITGDIMASTPTLVKSWRSPETESGLTYAAGIFNALTSFAAMKMWVFSEMAFPIYLIIMDLLLVSLVWRRKIFRVKLKR